MYLLENSTALIPANYINIICCSSIEIPIIACKVIVEKKKKFKDKS